MPASAAETTVLVTGATGAVGRHVAAALVDRDAGVRAGVRSPDATTEAVPDDAARVAFDFAKPET